ERPSSSGPPALAQTGLASHPPLGEGVGHLGMLRLSVLFLRALQHLRLREQGGLELGRRRPARDLQAVSGVTMNIFDGTRRVCRGHGCLVTAFANARSRLSGT